MKIFTDTEEMTHEDYLRVTIRSQGSQSFKGFLVKAVEVLNTDTQCKIEYLTLRIDTLTANMFQHMLACLPWAHGIFHSAQFQMYKVTPPSMWLVMEFIKEQSLILMQIKIRYIVETI